MPMPTAAASRPTAPPTGQPARSASVPRVSARRTLKTTALHQTPFAILGVTTRDDRRRIVELAEEKSLELDHDVCQKARSDLTNPRTRLSAEIARSEEHTSELKSLMRISSAVFCLKTKNKQKKIQPNNIYKI